MTPKTRQRLLDALESCETIRRYVAGVDFAAYLQDDEKQDAVERRLGIVGEALRKAATLDPSLAERLPELRQIVGLRNRVIHAYADLNPETIWTVVQQKLPTLQSRLESLIDESESS
jgi:uncharacterized protein with HEPN domain